MKVERALAFAQVALAFGRVERSTAHPDGTPESDATHTVMLALLVAEVAAESSLDVGLAVQFAVVHDLAETYAGDTCTARGLSMAEAAAKARRERAALRRLHVELGSDSWAVRMLERYERQDEPEARLVRYVDKVTPKLTHILNKGLPLRAIDLSFDEVLDKHAKQGRALFEQYPDQEPARRLFDSVCEAAEETLRPHLEGGS